MPTPGRYAVSSRILLQPSILGAVSIGDSGDQGIGLHVREGGVMVQVEPWSPMQLGDVVDLFWGAPDDPQSPGYPGTPIASKTPQFPEELNKAVLLSVPEDEVVAGWYNVLCRVTHINPARQELSPVLRVLVKLDRPGGIDPAPDENPNLAAPILPPEVIQDGVDTSWAARGVPVTIEPYPNMTVGDRIRLNWGGAFVEYTLRDSSEVNQPVTLIVDDATIRAAGDGDAVALRYQIFDAVNNRSGWSPTTEVVVNVQGDALFLPEVTNADDNGVIDLALLGSEDVRVLVTAFEPDFAVDDVVTLQWVGHTAEGVPVPYEDSQLVTRSPVQTLEFFVPNANVLALAQGDAVVSYSLQTGRASKQVRVTIAGVAASLSAPTVDEAPNDGDELDASLSAATVRIPPWPGMDAGDVVTLIWSGTRADGQAHLYTIDRQISGNAVGKEVVLAVSGSDIALLAGGTVDVWYEVMIGDGTPLRPSQVRTLRVSSGAGVFLPAPSVDEAPDGVTLNPDDVGLYAEVRIAPYPSMAVDDRVDMYWSGSGAGGNFSDWITIRAATLNKPILFDVDKAYVTANDGGTVTIRYTVTPQGGSPQSSAALTLRVGVAQGVIPAIIAVSDSQGDIPEGGTTEDTAVTLSGSAAADQDIELFDLGAISHGIANVDSAGLWTRAVTGLADGNHRFTAKGLYGNGPVSPGWGFTVITLAGLAVPVVTEADPLTNTLNLINAIDNVHVVIHYDGMAVSDVVTMVWQGVAGNGSTSQTVTVNAVGPLVFTVDNAAITPNNNRTVKIFYVVQRAGTPEESAVTSSALNLAIQSLAMTGTVAFTGSTTTSFYRCKPSSSVTVPSGFPINTSFLTTPLVAPSARTTFSCPTGFTNCVVNQVGSQPKSSSQIFPTRIPGVGFRANIKMGAGRPDAVIVAGPTTDNDATGPYTNSGTTGQMELVKIGPMVSGTYVLPAGVLLKWLVGSNLLYYMGWQLMNDVTIIV